MTQEKNTPLNALRHHVTGAIERGEKEAIVEQRARQIITAQLNEQLADLYLDWVNNFLTYEKFSAHYGLPLDAVHSLLLAGEKCHESRVELNKTLKALEAQ